MRIYKTIISSTEPTQGDVLWAKPNNDNFALYLLDGGKWKPIEAEGGGDCSGGIKAFKLIIDEEAGNISLFYNEDSKILYTAAEFGDDVSEEVKQETLKGIEANKSFANSVLEAINNGEPVCINIVYSNGTISPYTGQNTCFCEYEYIISIEDGNVIWLATPGGDTIINIPATISDDNTKYVLTDYVISIGEK